MKGRRKKIRVENKDHEPLKFDVNKMEAYHYKSMKKITWEMNA